MYQRAYGLIETLAPLHVGASAGEETGNLNLIFRDQFTQTGIIPGSSIRGRFRADMRRKESGQEQIWYGHEAIKGKEDSTTEAQVKFEYASIVWLPVFCPGQPIVWVSCPWLINRYQRLSGLPEIDVKPYSYFGQKEVPHLFFNLGFVTLGDKEPLLRHYIPEGLMDLRPGKSLVLVVDDCEMSMIHDMALYRQSRVSLEKESKKAKQGAFFDVEALPEGTVLVFPFALKKDKEKQSVWEAYLEKTGMTQARELYFGGLESIGFGRTQVRLKEYQPAKQD